MNKVICNLCGTSYPENAAQCPICGYARSAEATSTDDGSSTYTYVKGGRFSKANVKKRNQASGMVAEKPVSNKETSGTGLTVVIIVLLLAIVAVLGYVAVKFFLPEGFFNKNPESSQQEEVPPVTDEAPEEEPVPSETEPDLSCTAVNIDSEQLEFLAIGDTIKLAVTLEPADTIDEISFSSNNEAVATVSDDGSITAVGEGSAVITVQCGSVSAEYNVTVPAPEPETEPVVVTLNRKEITFNIEGQSWLLYDGDIPVTDIVWSSDDNKVATIENGKVVAVGNGDTTVNATYNGQTVTCVIHCKLDDDGSNESGNISEATGDGDRTYKLYNPYGFAEDVTLNEGLSFTLLLTDENILTIYFFMKHIPGRPGRISGKEVCSSFYKSLLEVQYELYHTE